jgi:hypothetical protein
VSHFPEAGIVKIRKPRYEMYVGLNKGGVIKAFNRDSRRLACNDCGYLGRMQSGKLITSQWTDSEWNTIVSEDELLVDGRFFAIKKPIMKPLPFLGFRMFSLSVGRMGWLARWLKQVLVKALIYKRTATDIQFRRSILLRDEGFTVRDEIKGPPSARVAELRWVDAFTTIHMGSSRYFVPSELEPRSAGIDGKSAEIDVRQLPDGVTVERHIRIS